MSITTGIMFALAFFLCSLLHLSFTAAAAPAPPLYNRTDYILLDCGASSNTTSSDGRSWLTDEGSKYLPSNSEAISESSTSSQQDSSITEKVPFMTARIFHSQFNYTFSGLSTGPIFLRLYFYPSTYSNFNKSASFFSVIANKHTLLSNFSAFLSVSDASATLTKEYIINIQNDQQLNITFLPSPNSYAFVNGIELVSIPGGLYYGQDEVALKLVGQEANPFYNIDNNTALETFYRLNVGGSDIAETNDTGMFRLWTQDDDHIFAAAKGLTPQGNFSSVNYTSNSLPYTAPEIVYRTARIMNYNFSLEYNMTWFFPVDSGFYYLLRLHFCQYLVEKESDMVFTIFINNKTAESKADVIEWANGPYVAVYRDYVAYVADPDGRRGKQDLWLAMHPYLGFTRYNNAILNGLEIFKFNLPNGSLAAPNPLPVLTTAPPPGPSKQTDNDKKKGGSLPIIAAVVGGVCLLGVALAGCLIFRRRRRVKHSATSIGGESSWVPLSDKSKSAKSTSSGSSLPSGLCRHFSLEEIKTATGNFDRNFVIGVGGFGNVYKGYIDNGATEVAIKRLNPSSNQGALEFLTEIEMLSKLRYLHLVSLIGYCDDDGEMILVYDYMARGTVRDHLYKTGNPPLPWKQRLQICIGAAKGLHYLHTSAKQTIIHRDVKSTNILLDEKWVAKVSDFGLSKMGPTGGGDTHVSTAVKGSFGYVDPEYYRRQRLTEKSDVYSFGVVLFEVLCGRPAVIPNLPKEQVTLAEYARSANRKGTIRQIVDPNVKDEIAPECLNKFVEIGLNCLKDKGYERPAMGDVVWSLEFALQLQEAAESRGPVVHEEGHGEVTTTDDDDMFSRSGEDTSSYSMSKSFGGNLTNFTSGSDGFKSETVFSEIKNPSAR